MNWFFNLVLLTITCNGVHTDENISPESVHLPEVEVIEKFSNFENATVKELFDSGRQVLKSDKKNIQEDLSYRHHGSHPANAKSWKLQNAWKAMHPQVGRQEKIGSALRNISDTMHTVRELCTQSDNDISCDVNAVYRSIDGTCNNLDNIRWGSAPQPFERFVPSDYGNGISTFRLSEEGKPLPNPRKISRALSNSKKAAQPKVTLMLVQWGQFLDHDITLTPEVELDTCLSIGGVRLAGQCLIFNKEPKTWEQAVEYCEAHGQQLAVLQDPAAVNVYLQNNYANTGEYFWLGGSDIKNEGSWVWLNSKPFRDQFPWPRTGSGGALQPDDYKGEQDCLAWGYKQNYDDQQCWDKFQYICEVDPVEVSSVMECCDKGQYANSVSLGEDCIPINVTGDSFYEQDGRQCLRFVRSMPALSGCEVNSPMEQINQNTAFVDGSMVYGSDDSDSDEGVANFVRTGYKGLLNTTKSEHVGNGQPLPPRGGDGFTHHCPIESEDTCFIAGDVRVDEVPGLTAMHTVFIRLHNTIAEDLCIVNPSWCADDELIFQETRRIVIALIQQITYREWLPLVVGQTLMDEYDLNTGTQGYSNTYDATVNPTIRNVFATAAFRFGHTLVAEIIKTAKEHKHFPRPGNFFNINLLEHDIASPASLLKGLSRCPALPVDAIVEPALTNHLYADHPATDGIFYGLDLVSINIQRGRDHGIPGYIKWRDFCGLESITEFWQLKKFMPDDLVHLFQHHYKSVDDIDLFPAGLAEFPIADGLLGPTFSCLIARQFAVLKHGDRFWYEYEGQPKPFTPAQLSSISSQNLVSILCRVLKHSLYSYQPNPFLVESNENDVRDCSSYNFINLQPWKVDNPDPCLSFGGTIIAGQCLFINEDSKTWAQAESWCQENGQRLAILQDPAAVHSYLQTNYGGKRFWLGGSDINQEGEWIWTNGQSMSAFPWGNGQPDDFENNEDCLEWGWKNNYNDDKCNRVKGFICQHDQKCPDGFFKTAGSNQCYKLFGGNRNWDQAKAKCEAENLQLAEPRNPIEVRSHLVKDIGLERWVYLGARGDGSKFVWQSSGKAISNTSPLWQTGNPYKLSTDRCLQLKSTTTQLEDNPNKPFYEGPCRWVKFTLCEVVPV